MKMNSKKDNFAVPVVKFLGTVLSSMIAGLKQIQNKKIESYLGDAKSMNYKGSIKSNRMDGYFRDIHLQFSLKVSSTP